MIVTKACNLILFSCQHPIRHSHIHVYMCTVKSDLCAYFHVHVHVTCLIDRSIALLVHVCASQIGLLAIIILLTCIYMYICTCYSENHVHVHVSYMYSVIHDFKH